MTFYKLIKTITFNNGTTHRIQYDHGIMHTTKHDNDYIILETNQVLLPLYDSKTKELVGFTNK